MFRRALLFALFACGERPQHAAAGADKGAAPPPSVPAGEASTTPAPSGVPAVVAEVGGQPITWGELLEKAAPELIAAEQAMFQARTDALNGMLMERLVEAEAKKLGTTPDAFVQGEVEAKAPPVTEAEISQFYAENQRRMQGSLDDMRPQIAQYLQQQRATDVLRDLVTRLETENGVKKFLPHYRLEVDPKDSPRKGSPTAPIQIVEFSDFQCPFCTDGAKTVRQIEEKYGDKVSVVYRHFPLPMHTEAHRAAQASQCANDQGEFWKFHDALFADQRAWTDKDFEGYAKTAGIDVKKFGECLTAGTHAATVDEDMADGRKAGMNGTPGFYVNGIVLSGARPFEEFVDLIDEELAKGGS